MNQNELNKVVKRSFECLRRAVTKSTYHSIYINEYSSLFNFIIGAKDADNVAYYNEGNEILESISNKILNIDDYSVLESPFKKNDANNTESEITQNPIAIILYSSTTLKTNQIFENSLFRFKNKNKVYNAELIVRSITSIADYVPIFTPSFEQLSNDIRLLSKQSFMPLKVYFSMSIETPPPIDKIFVLKKMNTIITPDTKGFFASQSKNDRTVFHEEFLNNTVLIHGGNYWHGYLKESYTKETVWYDLSNEEILFNEILKESYNAK